MSLILMPNRGKWQPGSSASASA